MSHWGYRAVLMVQKKNRKFRSSQLTDIRDVKLCIMRKEDYSIPRTQYKIQHH
jgi:hypothetical protein